MARVLERVSVPVNTASALAAAVSLTGSKSQKEAGALHKSVLRILKVAAYREDADEEARKHWSRLQGLARAPEWCAERLARVLQVWFHWHRRRRSAKASLRGRRCTASGAPGLH